MVGASQCASQSARKSQISQCWIGQGSVARRIRDELLEPAPNAPVVGAELLGPEGRALAGPEHDVHLLRRASLDASNLLGVEAELKDVVGLRVPSELGVDDLVCAVGLKLEKVGAPAPPRGVFELRLVDDVDGRLADEPSRVVSVARLDDGLAGRRSDAR